MKKISIVLSFLMMVSCGDKEEDKTETHTVSFLNRSPSASSARGTSPTIPIRDNSGSVTPLFGEFTLQPEELKKITYSCEDCPEFSFDYDIDGTGPPLCVCTEAYGADYAFGFCPADGFNSDDPRGSAKCVECSDTKCAAR